MNEKSLLILFLLCCLAAGFEYRTGERWYNSHWEERLDVYGMEELRLIVTDVELSSCDEGAFSFSRFAAGSPSCSHLLSTEAELQCSPHNIHPQRMSFTCSTHPPNSYSTLLLSMSCSGYQYPTNKIRDARGCVFQLSIHSPWLGLEVLGHMIAVLLTGIEALLTLLRTYYYGQPPLLTRFFRRCLPHFLYIPIFLLSCYLHSPALTFTGFVGWLVGVCSYSVFCIRQFAVPGTRRVA